MPEQLKRLRGLLCTRRKTTLLRQVDVELLRLWAGVLWAVGNCRGVTRHGSMLLRHVGASGLPWSAAMATSGAHYCCMGI